MTETYGYDKTPTPPRDYDASKVPPEIKKRATWVKTKFTGEDVAEAYGQAMEITGIYSDEAKQIAQQNKVRQDALENQFDAVQRDSTGKDVVSSMEIVAARGGKPTLGARLDETTAQLAQNVIDIRSRGISVKNPPIPMIGAKGDGFRESGEGTDDSDAIQAIINFASANHVGKVILNGAGFLISKAIIVPSNTTIEGLGMGITNIITGDNTFNAIELIEDARCIMLKDFSLFSVKGIGTSNAGIKLNDINGGAEHTFKDMNSSLFYYGFKAKELFWNSTLENVRFNSCRYSFYSDATGGQSINNTFIRCYSNEPLSIGFYVKTAKAWTFLNCNFGGHATLATQYVKFHSVCQSMKFIGCNFESILLAQDTGALDFWSNSSATLDSCTFVSNKLANGVTRAFEVKTQNDANVFVTGCEKISQGSGMMDFYSINNSKIKLWNNPSMPLKLSYSTFPIVDLSDKVNQDDVNNTFSDKIKQGGATLAYVSSTELNASTTITNLNDSYICMVSILNNSPSATLDKIKHLTWSITGNVLTVYAKGSNFTGSDVIYVRYQCTK